MDNRDLRNRNRTSSPNQERRTRPTNERHTRPPEDDTPPRRRMTREQRRQAYLRRRRKAYFFRGVFVASILLILLIFWLLISSLFKAFTNNDAEETLETDIITTEETESFEELIESNTVSFLAVGDNIGHERVFTYADENSGTTDDGEYDFLPSYTYMADYIADADLSFINQETIIGGDELGIYGYPAFNSPEQWASDLTTLGFDIVNASSNHSLDMGIDALENSLEIWSQYDEVLYAGVYDSEEDASTIRTIERNGITFSVISYTYSTNGYDIPNDYCINLFDEESIREDVAAAKEVSDVVIVSAHWGDESIYELNSLQTEYAQLFADLEVDLVIGTHPHVIQSLEWITGENGNETLVAYSLGNFLSTMETVDTQLEGMLTLDFVKNDDGSVSIENVEWTALINHFGDGTFTVMPLSEYTDELNAVHYVLAEECPNAIETFQEITDEIIGNEFTINY
ncbi:MAG: CapA family protein [Eubacteriales bacterium]